MNWKDLESISPLKLNIGGKHQHHPRRRWRRYVSVGLGVCNRPGRWFISVRLPSTFELPDHCVDAALSEHFIEHVNCDEAVEVMKEVCRVLKPGSRFRVAVPDMYHPRKSESLKAGRDLDDRNHRSVWTYDSLSLALLRAGFARLELLHYWDCSGVFHESPINHRRGGYVKRCPRNDKRNRQHQDYGEVWSTSLIIDAFTNQGGRKARVQCDETGKHLPVWTT